MLRTAKFLDDNDFFTFNMYNEMSDDPEENLWNILKGGEGEANNDAFLWDAMKDRQCLTYLSEEIGDFPSLLRNMSLNVEHDLRPFYSYNRQTTSRGHCTADGKVDFHEHIENWRNALLHVKKRCHFSMHYMKTHTKHRSEHLSLIDTELRMSLEALKEDGLFENTAFVLLSSRGNPLQVEDELFTARVEERSPLLSVKLPEKFLRKHYYSKLYLDINVNRLVSTRDVGMTLMDIAKMDFGGAPASKQVDELGGASLLQVAHAVYRSCDDAKIPPRLCLCMDEKTLLSKRYTNETAEFRQLFEYSKTEILKNECLQNVTEAPQHHTLNILSLNAMVQQGVRQENDWKEARLIHHDLGMSYVDIVVMVYPVPRSADIQTVKFTAQVRFRKGAKEEIEPIGVPFISWVNQRCHARRVDQYCEMCHYNNLISP
ncbi:hypothetical protein V3C99_008747 [Haemonchus contortus]|uniref:MEDS domain-containing protein n=1 Tax=Haemonchus contortus TaxID=6289 RepID=A0A7I4YKB2_HAECO